VLRFNASDEQRINVLDGDGDELDRFLKKVYVRRLQRDGIHLPVAAPAASTAPAAQAA
jgi:hypothetical protein